MGVPDRSATIVTNPESGASQSRHRPTFPRGSIRSTVPGSNSEENAITQQRWWYAAMASMSSTDAGLIIVKRVARSHHTVRDDARRWNLRVQ
jgi:hypothetical protein